MENKENNWDLGITFAWRQLEIKLLYLVALIIILFTELSKTLYALGINIANPWLVLWEEGTFVFILMMNILKRTAVFFAEGLFQGWQIANVNIQTLFKISQIFHFDENIGFNGTFTNISLT